MFLFTNKNLITATQKGDYSSVESAISKGASVDSKDETGKTLLNIALLNGHYRLAQFLLTKSPNVNAKFNAESSFFGQSIKKPENTTALHLAAKIGDINLISALINTGADVNAKNGDGDTPLHIAGGYGHYEAAELLIKHSASAKEKTKEGWLALHIAARNNYKEVCELLLGNGANINEQDLQGWTPLHYAASVGQEATTKFLIAHSADWKIKNINNKSAEQMAEEGLKKYFVASPPAIKKIEIAKREELSNIKMPLLKSSEEEKIPKNLQKIPWSNLKMGDLLGHGGYGDVYKATWHGTEVAIKKLHLKVLSTELQKEFTHEPR